jgi:hypothetical protein
LVSGSYDTAHRASNQTNLYLFGHPCQRRTTPVNTGRSFSRKTHFAGRKTAYDPKKNIPGAGPANAYGAGFSSLRVAFTPVLRTRSRRALFAPALQRLAGQPGQWSKTLLSMQVAFFHFGFHSRMLFTFALLFSISLTACKKDEPAKAHTLESARAAWTAGGKSSYTLDQQWGCGECPGPFYGKVRITVQNNLITNVISLKDGQPVPEVHWQVFSTVEGLFQRVEEFETRTPFKSIVQYDPQYGYPTVVAVNYSEEVMDDEFDITTSGLAF